MYQSAQEQVRPQDIERSIVKFKPYRKTSATTKVVPLARVKFLQEAVRLRLLHINRMCRIIRARALTQHALNIIIGPSLL